MVVGSEEINTSTQCVGCCGSVLPASIPPIQYYCTMNNDLLTNTNIMVASYSIIIILLEQPKQLSVTSYDEIYKSTTRISIRYNVLNIHLSYLMASSGINKEESELDD